MSAFFTLLKRDLAQLLLGGRRGGAVLPVLFFLAVAMLYPFAVGPDAPVLARTGGGVIWVAALLAAILPLDRLIGQKAAVWLLDEPLNGLDTKGVALVEELAAEHCHAGGIAVIASHQPFALPGMQRIEMQDFVR